MSAGYRQQPGNSSQQRKDGKRVAGKQVFHLLAQVVQIQP